MKILHQCLPTNESVFVGHAPPFKIIENIKILGKYEASFLTFSLPLQNQSVLKIFKNNSAGHSKHIPRQTAWCGGYFISALGY